ncbi:MAG: hypothetical protein WDO73_30115 [Ignavibacteriota bacterium]
MFCSNIHARRLSGVHHDDIAHTKCLVFEALIEDVIERVLRGFDLNGDSGDVGDEATAPIRLVENQNVWNSVPFRTYEESRLGADLDLMGLSEPSEIQHNDRLQQ